jgi:hypothetical protein
MVQRSNIFDKTLPPVEPWQIAVGVRLLTPEEQRQRLAYFERKARVEIPAEKWQRAIGTRLLTPLEQQARDEHFLRRSREAAGRIRLRTRASAGGTALATRCT